MLANIWNDFLYQPGFNALIWIYNNWTDLNLGWAIVYLTVILRMVLVPFTLINERNRIKNQELADDIDSLSKELHADPVRKKMEIRKMLKKRKVQPWAKAIVLGIQALFLVLLYQIFLRGITGEKILKILYPSVDFPGVINTDFYGFDLGGERDLIWAGAVAILLFAHIYFDLRKRRMGYTRADLAYFVLFPTVVFLVLYFLPMVKSLFVITSLVFSIIVSAISKLLFRRHLKSKS